MVEKILTDLIQILPLPLIVLAAILWFAPTLITRWQNLDWHWIPA